MKLYYVPKTRATRPRWVLEELGLSYELARLDPKAGETRTPEHLRRHPLGHVPVLEDGGVRIFESGAICLWLADRDPERRLLDVPGTPGRAQALQWIFYGVTELETPLGIAGAELRKGAAGDAALVAAMKQRLAAALGPLEAELGGRSWIAGDRFTVADVVLASLLASAQRNGLLPPSPALEAYLSRATSRPAASRALAD
ncbi:glutathione S-transferase family protein [Anaeromyxobacter paludicola]|uniref:Glutathione S-transferase n=1 Tax=Anaeromyxobacter paludicola TaxID=2918171 RepID=A0ABM7XFI4_9BACT|nr:glutathione S-transferase family protein [Anaeromyxobacter paludicola]BDG10671.1 glutathione S-transferase [Anaeromyxobacter paludicola]